MDERIRRRIRKTRIWVFFKNTVNNMLWCLPIGAAIGMLFEFIGYFVPWYFVHRWSISVLVLSGVVALVLSVVKFPSVKTAAAELDKSGLKERAQTAVELLGNEDSFAKLQKEDAYRAMLGSKITKMIPLNISWKRPAILFMCGFLMITFALLPSNAKDIAARNYELVSKAKEEIAKVEKVEEELKEELPAEELEEYKDILKDVISELEDADSKEEIDKTLERAETKLKQMSEKTENQKAKDAMTELAKSLSEDRKDAQADSKNSEMMAAAKELEDMLEDIENAEALSELSDEELQELLDKLEDLEAMANGELSESELANLDALSDQIKSGQISNDTLAAVKATMKFASSSSSQLAQNSNSDGDSGDNNGGDGDGNGSGDGSGNGNGNGNGSGNGNGNGNGSGGGDGHGGGWNYGSKDGNEEDKEFGGDMVSIPNEMGDDDNLTGQASDGASYVSKGGQALTWSGKQVNYNSVFGQYKNKAYSKIENGNYPSQVSDIIKSYFEKISN